MKKNMKKVKLNVKIDEWLKYVGSSVKISTYSYYYNVVDKHIKKKIGHMKIKSLNEFVINNYINSLYTECNIKDSTIRQIVIILKQIFKFCKIDLEIQLPKVKKRKITVLSEADKKKIKDYLYKNIKEETVGILLSMQLGLRIGEVCALKWKNIDLENGYMYIENTVERVKNFDNFDKRKTKLVLIKAKTDNSVRTLPLSDRLITILKKINCERNDNYFLLTSSEKIADPRSYYNHYQKILRICNVENNYHTLRHTFATDCVDFGINAKALSNILGHSDIKTTLTLYVHPSIKRTKQFLNDNIF